MQRQWIAMEHYRLHSVEEWPDSPRKQATLTAIRSTLDSVGQADAIGAQECSICLSRQRGPEVLQFPQRPGIVSRVTNLVA